MTMNAREIAAEALADIKANEQEHTDAYWIGFLLATLERITETD